MIAKGVPDVASLRNALEMGYEVIDGALWWPTYDWAQYSPDDWKKGQTWPAHIHNQGTRVGVTNYRSPDGAESKRV